MLEILAYIADVIILVLGSVLKKGKSNILGDIVIILIVLRREYKLKIKHRYFNEIKLYIRELLAAIYLLTKIYL